MCKHLMVLKLLRDLEIKKNDFIGTEQSGQINMLC